MRGIFVDTNIFLRIILNDEPVQARDARSLLESIEQGRVEAWTSALVVSELVFVLGNRKTYDVPRADIRDLLLPLINLSGLKLERKHLYERAFDLYVDLPIDYVDAYHAALIEHAGQNELLSFDTDFDRIPGITRIVPQILS